MSGLALRPCCMRRCRRASSTPTVSWPRTIPRIAPRTARRTPAQLLPMLRSLAAALPHPPIAMQIEVGAEQIMLGGRPLQNLVADLHSDTTSWAIDRLDLRAPGSTHVVFSGTGALT